MTEIDLTRALGLWPALFGGVLLGAAFYGSLWWTVRHGLPSPRAGLWFACSMMLRTSVAMGLIYVIGDGRWDRLATCLLGFVMARSLVVGLTRSSTVQIESPQG